MELNRKTLLTCFVGYLQHLQKFKKAVTERGTKIYFMPKNFSRHKENTTVLDWNTGKISWRLEVIFMHAQQYQLIVDK